MKPLSPAINPATSPAINPASLSLRPGLSVGGKFALCGVILLLLAALFAPLLAPYDPTFQDLDSKLAPLGSAHWLGTDHLGRDIFSRLLYGARLSLGSAFVILGIIITLGIGIGGLCGLLGGRVDRICMRICDVFLSLPTIALSLFFVGVLGAGLDNVIIAIALTHWAWYARIVRSIVFKLKNKEFVLLSRTFGLSPAQKFKRHILTPILSQCAVLASMDLGHMMLHIAALSFLGLGVQAPTPEWGIMLSEAKDYMWSEPSLILYPGLALFVSVALCNLLGEALRDYFDVGHIHNGIFQAKLSLESVGSESRRDCENIDSESLDSELSESSASFRLCDVSIILPNGRELLTGANLTLKQGEILALMGRSGSGKSLLALAMQGVIAPSVRVSGEMYYGKRRVNTDSMNAASVNASPISPLSRRGIFACIMQNPSSCFNPLLSIQSHFKESAKALGLAYNKAEIIGLLQEVGLEERMLYSYSFELSGGQLQRVMIALALLSNAPFLIADEPSSDLDYELSLQILDLIKRLQKARGFGMLLITHDRHIARLYAHRAICLRDTSLCKVEL